MRFLLTSLACTAVFVGGTADASTPGVTARAYQGNGTVEANGQYKYVITDDFKTSDDSNATAFSLGDGGFSQVEANWGVASLVAETLQQDLGGGYQDNIAIATYSDSLVIAGAGAVTSVTNSYAVTGNHVSGRVDAILAYVVTAPVGTFDRDSFKTDIYYHPDELAYEISGTCFEEGLLETCVAGAYLTLLDELGIGEFAWSPTLKADLPVGMDLLVETNFVARSVSLASTFSLLDMRHTFLFEGMSGSGIEQVTSARFGVLPTRGGRFGYQAAFDALGGVPEPQTWATMMIGFFGIGAMARRKRPAARLVHVPA